MKTGIELITDERKRQTEVEGYTPEHDDSHKDGSLAAAAACYATPPLLRAKHDIWMRLWPGWKKKDTVRIRELVISAALLAAEIDRLQRLGKS